MEDAPTKPLYIITDGSALRLSNKLIEHVKEALCGAKGRVSYVQLREQVSPNTAATDREVIELARTLLPICHSHSAKLIINRRADLTRIVGADGVQLGARSIGIEDARKLIGTEKHIGYSAHSEEEAVKASKAGANYVLLGPIFSPRSKQSYTPPLGLRTLAATCKQVKIPVFALGGITNENAELCRQAGASGVATISSAILARNPFQACSNLVANWTI
ncbi:MAG: thiamine phosphate synthase [Deltaproteobacteria bacterium]|nr:thiamine phosphate synthase [Deltaproteobacteria bacterium]